jgi:hypothetical protein
MWTASPISVAASPSIPGTVAIASAERRPTMRSA